MRVPLLCSCLAAAWLTASCGRPETAVDAKPVPPAGVKAAPSAPCPPTISVTQTLSAAVAGWEPFEDETPAQLMSVGVFDGHPRERASLVPDADDEAAGKRTAVWQLSENGRRGYWLVCYYDRSRLALTRALPGEITRVEVTRDPQVTIAGQPEITAITVK